MTMLFHLLFAVVSLGCAYAAQRACMSSPGAGLAMTEVFALAGGMRNHDDARAFAREAGSGAGRVLMVAERLLSGLVGRMTEKIVFSRFALRDAAGDMRKHDRGRTGAAARTRA
ncbi:hypothetical protein OH491_22345 [Termitidicoccus mucosus]|uniref:hypothetical protein n=1 Tax=Termitidicoccus mucosus TaxID=1184151 RepID=UPI0011AB67C6